jgi:hypothetical protein
VQLSSELSVKKQPAAAHGAEHDAAGAVHAAAGVTDDDVHLGGDAAESDDERRLVGWADRAAAIGAAAVERGRGRQMFRQFWDRTHHALALAPDEIERLADYMSFVSVPAAQNVIHQDERGDFLLIVLDGALAIERVQPWGGRARLAEARVGDVIGEMALLDAGGRFSTCDTLAPSVLAVLEARRLDEMMLAEPRLALALLATLARRLSLRLRQVSARLSALLSGS